jgi:F0F1-type ATP synthase assembly protein I
MQTQITRIVGLKLVPAAKKRVQESSDKFNATLITQAQLAAELDGHNQVLEKHVEDAYRSFMRSRTPEPIWFSLIGTFSGILIGLGIPGFIAEVTHDPSPRPAQLIVFVILGIIGIIGSCVAVLAKR